MNKAVKIIRRLVRSTGYDVKRYIPEQFGIYPLQDMCFFTKAVKCPVIFDVGANVGQTVGRFKEAFPVSSIHSFEPSPSTFAILNEHCKGLDGVKTWHCGVGSREATLPFLENDNSDMSSFLAPTELCWGKITKKTDVKIIALDSFAKEQGIEFVHILKSDTQGFDFEVFKGAEGLMRENRIGLLYFEFIFSNQYKDLPSFHEVFRFLSERNFSLVCLYRQFFQENLLGWTDLLFINRDYHRRFEQANAVNAAKE